MLNVNQGAAGNGRALFGANSVLRLEEFFVFPCPCKTEIPFGRSRRHFNVMQWDSAMRVVSGSGGRPNGMAVGLHVAACWGGLLSCTFREAARQV